MDSVENVQDVHGIYGLSTDGISSFSVILTTRWCINISTIDLQITGDCAIFK